MKYNYRGGACLVSLKTEGNHHFLNNNPRPNTVQEMCVSPNMLFSLSLCFYKSKYTVPFPKDDGNNKAGLEPITSCNAEPRDAKQRLLGDFSTNDSFLYMHSIPCN